MSPDGGVFAFGDGDEAPATAVTMRNVRSSMVNLEPDSGSSVGLVPINALVLTGLANFRVVECHQLASYHRNPGTETILGRRWL